MERTIDEHIRIRPLIMEDDTGLWPYMSNAEISEEMSWDAHKDISETRSFLERVIATDGINSYTRAVLFDNQICGIFSLITVKRKHRSLTYDSAELAYWIGPEFQGKGIMTKVGEAFIAFAFDDLNLNKLVVAHHSVNEKSKGLILRLGFEFEYEEKRAFSKHGVWKDVLHYVRFNPDYKSI